MENHEIEELVVSKITAILNNREISSALSTKIAINACAMNLQFLHNAQKISSLEFIAAPIPYNDRGDIAVMIPRHYFDPEHAMTIVITYGVLDDSSNTIGYSYILMQQNMSVLTDTKFCNPEPELAAEINRQIGSIFSKELENRSAIWTLVTIPYADAVKFLPHLYAEKNVGTIVPEPVVQCDHGDPTTPRPAVKTSQPKPEPSITEQQPASALDEAFPPIL